MRAMEQKLTPSERKWAENALRNQGDLVRTAMKDLWEPPGKKPTAEEILEQLAVNGLVWKLDHVLAGLNNLKARGLVIFYGKKRFGLSAAGAAK